MEISGRTNAAFHQTQGVARSLGINLTTARAEGRLSGAALAGMLERCKDCTLSKPCTAWLSQSTGVVARAPGFCPNRAVLDRLAREGPRGGQPG